MYETCKDKLLVPKEQSKTYLMVPTQSVKYDLVTKNESVIYVPIATRDTYGIVKIGDGLNIDNGTISFDENEITIKSISKNGIQILPDEQKNVDIVLNKYDVGLDKVDNTSDVDKPVSIFQQIELDKKLNIFQGIDNQNKMLYVNSQGNIDFRQAPDALGVEKEGASISTNAQTLDFSNLFLVTAAGTKVKIDGSTELKKALKDVVYNGETGVLSFTRIDGSVENVDLPLELIVSGGYYNAETHDLVLRLANGDEISIPLDDIAGIVWTYSDFIPGTKETYKDQWLLKKDVLGESIEIGYSDGSKNSVIDFHDYGIITEVTGENEKYQGVVSSNGMAVELSTSTGGSSLGLYQGSVIFNAGDNNNNSIEVELAKDYSTLIMRDSSDNMAGGEISTTELILAVGNNTEKINQVVSLSKTGGFTLNDKRILTVDDLTNVMTTESNDVISGTKIFEGVIGLSANDGADVAQIRNYGTAISILGGDGNNILYLNEVDKTVSAFNKRLAFIEDIAVSAGTNVTVDGNPQITWEANTKLDKRVVYNGTVANFENNGSTVSMGVMSSTAGSIFGMSENSIQIGMDDGTSASTIQLLPTSIDLDADSVTKNGVDIVTTEDLTFNNLKRYNAKSYSGSSTTARYYPLCKFPTYNSPDNYASVILLGRLGGWEANNCADINIMLTNRAGENGAVLSLSKNSTRALEIVDIVQYRQEDGTTQVYLKCTYYYAFDFNLQTTEGARSDITINYDGTYLSEPVGTLQWSASSAVNKLEVSGGKVYIGGKELPTLDDVVDKTTEQTISGKKTFNNHQNVYAAALVGNDSFRPILIGGGFASPQSLRYAADFGYTASTKTMKVDNIQVVKNITDGTNSKTVKQISDAVDKVNSVTSGTDVTLDGDPQTTWAADDVVAFTESTVTESAISPLDNYYTKGEVDNKIELESINTDNKFTTFNTKVETDYVKDYDWEGDYRTLTSFPVIGYTFDFDNYDYKIVINGLSGSSTGSFRLGFSDTTELKTYSISWIQNRVSGSTSGSGSASFASWSVFRNDNQPVYFVEEVGSNSPFAAEIEMLKAAITNDGHQTILYSQKYQMSKSGRQHFWLGSGQMYEAGTTATPKINYLFLLGPANAKQRQYHVTIYRRKR